jgi:hypothetical protein
MWKDKIFALFKVRGKTQQETLENISFLMIILSAAMLALGLALGSFFKYVILLAPAGAFTLLVAIVLFIISQFISEEK